MSYILSTVTKDFGYYKEERYSVRIAHGKVIKRFKPENVNGVLKRVDMLTGEISDYSRKDFENSTKRSKNRTLQKFRDIVYANKDKWQFFGTLTFDKEKIERLNDEAVIKAYEKFANNLKHKFSDLVYVTMVERHKKQNAIHFHLLVGCTSHEELKLVDSGKRQRSGVNKGAVIYNCEAFKYGFTTFTEIVNVDATIKYCEKYLTKSVGNSTAKGKKRFYYSRNLLKPKVTKESQIYNFKPNLESMGLLQPKTIFEIIKYYSKEKNFLIKTETIV